MIFTKQQTEKLLEIIDFHTAMFVTTQMGEDVLSSYDKFILGKFGFNVKKIVEKYPPYLQSFLFGRLTGWLSENQASKIVYKDFNKYLKSGQYFPLTKQEQTMYDLSIQRSYGHIKNLGVKRKDELTRQINEEEVRKELSEAIKKRESIQTIISNWGHKHENWQRDYGRIAETEMNSIFQLGRALQLKEKHGAEVKVFKNVFPGACRHCIRLYLTGGIGSKPKLFTIEELQANGSNIGRKVADWKPVVESTHPFCFDKKTEVLTNEGWKYFQDLNKTETFLSINLTTLKSEYVRAVKWIDQPYKGQMILRSNKNFSHRTSYMST